MNMLFQVDFSMLSPTFLAAEVVSEDMSFKPVVSVPGVITRCVQFQIVEGPVEHLSFC